MHRVERRERKNILKLIQDHLHISKTLDRTVIFIAIQSQIQVSNRVVKKLLIYCSW